MLSALFGFMFVLGSMFNWFPRIDPPQSIEHIEGHEWRGGTIYQYDSSSYPGGYWLEVRWRGNDASDVLLHAVGDCAEADIEVIEDRVLIRYELWQDGKRVIHEKAIYDLPQ